MAIPTYHEVTLDELELVRETLLGGVPRGAVDLVVVVVEAGDVRVGELGNLPRGAADTAADVENLHVLLDADLHGQVVLVARDSLVEGLADRVAAEVEALAPAILVEVGSKVVVAVRKPWSVSSRGGRGGERWVSGATYCLVRVAYSFVRACLFCSVSKGASNGAI